METMTAMYETFYGFSQPPFGLTPDVRFCYQHRSYTRAKAYMEYAVMRGEGFLVVTARPGMGKTTLIQDLLGDLGSEQRLVARIDSTQLDADDLLRLVAYAFGLAAKGLDKATLLHNLGDFLRRRPAGAGTAILIVDEAQNLPDRSLEELRLITNLQQGASPLIQIFLVGQESLRDVIRQRNLEQLQQRVVAACHLDPLDLPETRAYVRHRLLCAGWSGDPTFEAEALGLIHRASAGVPRVINKVCDRLLLYGSVDELHRIRGADARLVIEEFQGEFLETVGLDAPGGESSRPEGAQGSEIEDLCWNPGDGVGAPGQGVQGAVGEPRERPPTDPFGVAIGLTSDPNIPAEGTTGPGIDTEQPWPAPVLGFPDHAPGHPHPGLISEAEPRVRPTADPCPASGPIGPASPPQGADAVTAVRGPSRSAPHRRSFPWPFAAAAAVLLGLGGIAWAIHGRTPDGVLVPVSRLTYGALSEIQSAARGLVTGLQDAVQTLRPSVEGRVASIAEESVSNQGPLGLDEANLGPEGGQIRPESADQGDGPPTAIAPIGFLSDPSSSLQPDPAPEAHPDPSGSLMDVEASGSVPAESIPLGSEGDLETRAAPAPALDTAEPDATPAPGRGREGPAPLSDPLEHQITGTGSIGPVTGAGAQGREPSPQDEGSQGTQVGEVEISTGSDQAAVSMAADVQVPAAVVTADTPSGLEQTPMHVLKDELYRLGLRAWDQGEGVISFDLAGEVPFDFGSARLPDQAQAILEPLAQALRQNPGLAVTLVGHTDDAGPADYNRRLSLARARAVEASLRNLGVAGSRLSSRGMGKDAPAPDESNLTAARHRRVEVVIRPAVP